MSTITRMWLAFAALGTGLVHLGLVVGSPLPLAALFAVLGTVELVWALLTFSRDRLVAPRWVIGFALGPVVAWALAMMLSAVVDLGLLTDALPPLPLAVASLLELFAAVTVALAVRRGRDLRAKGETPPAGRYLLGLFAGAIVVAGLVTPALSATTAGQFAQPHGEHSYDLPSHGEH